MQWLRKTGMTVGTVESMLWSAPCHIDGTVTLSKLKKSQVIYINGDEKKALTPLDTMMLRGYQPDRVNMIALTPSCASVAASNVPSVPRCAQTR